MQWRKQGDEQWQSTRLPLQIDGNKELVFIHGTYHNTFKCAKCKKSLNETPYLWYRPVLRGAFSIFTEKRYCVKHTPISIEIDMQQRPTRAQRVAATDSDANKEADSEPVTEKPTPSEQPTAVERPLMKAGMELPQILWWRKQGDHGPWQFVLLPLKSEGKELQFIFAQQPNQFSCATCRKSLSRAQYLLYRPAPYERYCLEHSPIPIETEAGPGLFQRFTFLERRIADLEARITELEARKGDNPQE